jgi:hypothetical protein
LGRLLKKKNKANERRAVAMPKYTLKFRKQYQARGIGIWEEITDSSLMSTLLSVQEKYNFEIVSFKFKDCFSRSHIKIKCNKDDKCEIFCEFCLRLNGQITDIEY